MKSQESTNKLTPNKDLIIQLDEKEFNLIMLIREKYRYGEVTLITHAGLPQKIKKVTEFEDLGTYPQQRKPLRFDGDTALPI